MLAVLLKFPTSDHGLRALDEARDRPRIPRHVDARIVMKAGLQRLPLAEIEGERPPPAHVADLHLVERSRPFQGLVHFVSPWHMKLRRWRRAWISNPSGRTNGELKSG